MAKRIAIAELSGALLDWAVSVAVGMSLVDRFPIPDGGAFFAPSDKEGPILAGGRHFTPTTDWSQCGPMKARYKIDTIYLPDGSVRCRYPKKIGGFPCFDEELGRDELTATCRAIVAAHSPSGYVEVPDELVEGE